MDATEDAAEINLKGTIWKKKKVQFGTFWHVFIYEIVTTVKLASILSVPNFPCVPV